MPLVEFEKFKFIWPLFKDKYPLTLVVEETAKADETITNEAIRRGLI